MSNILLSSQNLIDAVTSWYGDTDGGSFPLSNFSDPKFSKVWRKSPATNADGNVAGFAYSLASPARCNHWTMCRQNFSDSGQIRVRAGTSRLDVDFTDSAEVTSPYITFSGGTNGTRTNEYGVLLTGQTCPRYEHDRRFHDNGFTWSEDISQSAWQVNGCKVLDKETVDFATVVGARLFHTVPFLYAVAYEIKAQVRVVSGDPSFQFSLFDGSAVNNGTTQTATTSWQWFTSTITATAGGLANSYGAIIKAVAAGVLKVRKLQITRGSSNGKYRKTTTQRRYQRIGLVTEAGATNSLIQSQDYTQAAWTKTVTVTAASGTAPDGTNTITSLSAGAIGNSIFQDLTLGGTTTRAATLIFQKGGTATSVALSVNWMTGGVSQSATVTFNPSSGAFVSSAASGATLIAAGVKDIGGGYFRAYVIGTGTDAANTVVRMLMQWNTTGTALAWGSQNEASFVTTYIPTATAAVTRTVETAVVEAATWLPYVLNPNEFTLYHEAIHDGIATNSFSNASTVGIVSGGNAVFSQMVVDTAGNFNGHLQATGGAGGTLLTADTAIPALTVMRAATRSRGNDWAYACNGSAVQTNTSIGMPSLPIVSTSINLMYGTSTTCYLRRVTIWPTGKSNTDVQALSAGGTGAVDFDSAWDDVLAMTGYTSLPTLWGHDYDIIKTFTDRAVEWVRVGMYDPAKTASTTPFEAGRIFMGGLSLQPAVNASFGLSDGWNDATSYVETQSRRRLFNELPKEREVAFSLNGLTQAEGALLHEIDGTTGVSGEVLYLPDPSDEAACQRYGFVGLMKQLDVLRYPLLDRRSKSYEISKKR